MQRGGQVGLFSSVKYASLSRLDVGGLLVQGAATVDYVFSRGRLGGFGTMGLRDRVLVHQRESRHNYLAETMLQVVDQVGLSGQLDVFGGPYLEGSAAYLDTAGEGGRVGGTLRVVMPAGDQWALVAEGGWNETLIAVDETNARFLVGMQFGRWTRPTPVIAPTGPVPVDIPRLRYEITTRERRAGNDRPTADAGPDQIDVQSDCPAVATCTLAIQLDGSGSFDPEGDELSFQWEPRSGFEEGLTFTTPLDQRRVSFVGREGGRYVLRLAVRDRWEVDFDEVTITIAARQPWRPPTILRFDAQPAEIPAGGWSQMSWAVRDANRVTIDQGIGVVPSAGTLQADPVTTTTYTLRATNEHGEVAQRSVTITVVPAH
jgi:hypothetical protein